MSSAYVFLTIRSPEVCPRHVAANVEHYNALDLTWQFYPLAVTLRRSDKNDTHEHTGAQIIYDIHNTCGQTDRRTNNSIDNDDVSNT